MNRQVRTRTENERGFTLIEVMVTMVILAVGLLAVAGMQVISIKSNTTSRDVTEASTLAMDRLEFLKVLPVDDDQLDEGEHDDAGNPVEGKYTVTWNVTDNEETKAVTVLVDWESGHKQKAKQVELPTIILDK